MEKGGLSPALRIGLWVFIALVVLTVGEFFLFKAVDDGNLPYMIIMNIVDAALIIWFFMHLRQLWHSEE